MDSSTTVNLQQRSLDGWLHFEGLCALCILHFVSWSYSGSICHCCNDDKDAAFEESIVSYHVDMDINNLKNMFKVDLEQLKNMRFICDKYN